MPTEGLSCERFAIIGVGCRMPPNANSLDAFWKFLGKGGNALKPVRKDRWDWRQFFDEDPQRPGKTYAPKGAFLDADIRQFDPLAFGMSPREAASLDPQQRLLLEVAWEAFADAGIPLHRVSGSATGVFVGGFCLDHLVLQAQPSNRHLINAHSAGGVMMTVLSNRLSHAFNLQGPSLTLDTACSSSLVALHYACQSLRLRECDMVLAGGANVMTRPEFPIIMSKGHFLSPHGECHAFDETAAGYARGEGAGIFLLKRLDEALAAGDKIHAVVRATGVNQDGHTDGISLPNSDAQEALIQQVYRAAGVPCADVDYVEAHGTGTQAGDSAELRALNRNFSAGRKRKLLVGSVKTNVGHLEAAAGVAGVLKAIGVLKHRQVPRNLHFKTPNPQIPFADYALEIASETRDLPPEAEKPTLYAGINSFGYGGTNAHVLLESAPSVPVRSAADAKAGPQLIPFSATNERALRDLAGKMAFQLGQPLPGTLSDLAYSAAFRRSHLAHRGAALAENLGQLREQLIAVSTGQPHDAVVTGAPAHDAASGLVFVYTGMGPQWWAMGQELIRGEPVVAAAIDEIDAVFQPLAGWSLREAMLADEATSRMEHTDLAQPANFALQAALTRLWESHGIRPAAVVGHSVGEVAAAYAAGVYTLEEAVRVSYHRSRLQQTMAGRGAMLAAGLAEPEAEKLLAAFPGVSLAAVNSFSAVTLSGDAEELRAIAADLEQRGIFHKFLRVEVAYHSPQMDPLREELLSVLADLAPRPARLPLYSTAFGAIVPHHEWTAEYWWRNVRQPVRFAAAMQAAMAEGFAMFLEVGPHPVLGNSIKECAAHLERRVVCFTSLRRKEPEKARMLLTLGELYCAGCDPDWTALAPTSGRLLPAPQYPWQRETHWVESERSKMERLGLPGPVYLNRTVSGPNPCWEVEINRNYFPFLFDHGVQDQTVFAGMGYIEAALALSRKIHGTEAVVLENVSFERVLIVDPAKLQYLLTEHDADGGRFVVSSRTEGDDDGAQRHCRGRMFPQSAPQPGTLDLAALRERLTEEVRGDAFYERLRRRQLHYGPAFRTAKQLLRDGDSFLLTIDTSAVAGEDLHPLHPSIFDAALQAVIYCASGEQLFVPFGFERFQYFARPVSDACHAFGRIISQTATRIVSDVWLADANGAVIARACGLALQIVELAGAPEQEELFYAWRWEPVPHGGEEAVDGKDFLVLADAEDSDLALARALAGRLPGSALEIREIAAPRGLGRPEMERLLRAHGRRRIVVLWGSGPAASGVDAALGLSEKAVGLLQAVGAADAAGGVDVTFVTRGAVPAAAGEGVPNLRASALGAIGLTALNEFEGLVCRTVDLDSAGSADLVLAELGAGGSGDIAWRGGERMERVLRVRKEEKSPPVLIRVPVDDALELQPVAKGGLDALQLVRGERTVPGPGEIEIRIHRAALGTRDLLKIRGEIHPVALENALGGPEPGLECTGIVSRCGPGSRFSPGDRVAALVPRALRTYATVSETLAVPLPEQWGMDAAAIPAAGLAAWVGLLDLARLQPGDRVFLPDAADGPGLAAVDVALRAGAEVFATAASEEHRQALRARGVAHVFSSEGLDCRERIRDATDGEGVDVIFGAESGLARLASLGLLRSGGRCIATGKNDIAEDRDLPLRVFNRNAMFAALDVARLAFESPARVRDHLGKMFAQFAEGDLPPPATRTFPADQIREAFAALAAGPAPETVLIDFATGDAGVPETPEDGPLIKKDGSYIVTGGTSGFGLATARWLATQGAGKVFLVSRSGRRAPGLQDTTRFLTAQGAEAEVLSVDVTDAAAVRSLVEQAGRAPFALRGIVHGAMVLGDAMMQDLDEEKFRRVFLPKVSGAWHLADAVADRGGLDFLVFYSSVSALVGNRGQANYVAANSLLDGLAHELRHRGVPALSVNWGALGESGVVSRDEHLSGVLAALGITGLQNQQALGALETSLRAQEPQRGIFLVDWEKWHAAHPKLREDPRFRALRSRTAKDGNDAASQIRQSLADATREQRISALENSLQEVLANTLKMPKDAVPVNRRINEMGVDSLMVLELGLGIRERIGISFSAMEFLKGPNLRQLAVLAEGRLWKN